VPVQLYTYKTSFRYSVATHTLYHNNTENIELSVLDWTYDKTAQLWGNAVTFSQ